MASSQIEIASASPPFGCILRDHNLRDSFRESENGRLAFQKNINEFVRDFHTYSSSNTNATTTSMSDENTPRLIPNTTMSPSGLRKIDARWSSSLENEEESPCLPQSAGNSPNMGAASSLVQMWEARLNRSQSLNQNSVNSPSSSRTNSGMSNAECASSKTEIEMDNQSHQAAEEEVEAAESQHNAPESANESERVRVADIIKRLTKTSSGGDDQGSSSSSHNNDQEHSRESSPETTNRASSSTCISSPRIRERLDQQRSSLRVALPQMSNSPRLRGRQAIQDLLTQMERDRQSEIHSLVDRKAVTKFAQKGRIQSMLRLKVLQRGLMPLQDHLVPSPPARPKGTSSSIAARRSRFDPEAESQAISKASEDECSSRSSDRRFAPANEVANSIMSRRRPCLENTENSHPEGVSVRTCCKDSLQDNKQDAAKDHACEVGSSSSALRQLLGDDDASLCREAISISPAILDPPTIEEQHVQQRDWDASEYMHEIGSLASYVTWQDPSFDTNEEGSCWDGNRSMMSADDNSQQHYEAENNNYYGWFSDISRPRRYWEDRRRAWYQEVLETTSENAEIRQLLERKTVSNFLDSSFRLRMDQMIMTRFTTNQAAPPVDEDQTNQATMMHLYFYRRQSNQQEQEETHDEEEERGNNVDLEEDRNVIGSEYNEVSSYFEQNPESPQLPLPSPMSSSTWSSFRESEQLSEASEQAGSNRPQGSPFHYANIGRTQTPSTNPTSLEMELIYHLKRHMEQLYQEMTELRSTIRCCMDMQAKLQLSFKQEAAVDLECTREPGNGTAVTFRKGSCCICYEMPVDSLLYRCGHMCTCLKCAQELQCSSGRCPICRAPIMDVVRAYTDS